MGAKGELADIFKGMGYAQPNKVIDLVQKVIWDELREEFIRCLTVDSKRSKRIFDPDSPPAEGVDFQDVLAKYDQAVRRMKAQ